MKTPAERLVAALAALNITQQELSERLGVGRSAVSHWTNGRRSIDVELASRIASALGIRPAWLAFGDGEMTEISADAPPTPPPPTPKRRTIPPPAAAAPRASKRKVPKRKATKPGPRKVEPRSSALPEDFARAS